MYVKFIMVLRWISKHDHKLIIADPKQQRKLNSPNGKITAYGGHEPKSIGTCQLNMYYRGDVKPVVFSDSDVEGPSMPGCETSRDLELVRFN